ncbi:MAG TPA: acyloxyacyl hydrolase [Candidatus Paceibacterota bacterium]|nr:acyloxyacyl hydrolase [Candidatus Paceibacterota bacterium]
MKTTVCGAVRFAGGLVLIVTTVAGAESGDWSFESAGVRAGTSINNRSDTFRQVEAVADLNTPWNWQLGSDWRIAAHAEFSAGWLHGEGEEAAIGTAGPVASLSWKDFPVTLDAGSSPTLLSKYRFGPKDYGLPFQFTTHIGVNWKFADHFSAGYRYQHMSNAGLGSPNPGLNLHMLGLNYHF